MKTLEINTLIAEFMGYEIGNYLNQGKPIYTGHKNLKTVGEQKKLWNGLDLQFTGRFTEYVQYPFENDFNYLLPVIIKIENMGFAVSMDRISYKIYRLFENDKPLVSLVCGDLTKKTEMMCNAITSFIEMYNRNEIKL